MAVRDDIAPPAVLDVRPIPPLVETWFAFSRNKGTLAGWIADSQHLKPSNKMPPFAVFTGVQLRALAAYMESLK